jgi:hypothetical protein
VSLIVTAFTTILLALSLVGVVAGAIKAGDGMSRHSRATYEVVDRFNDSTTDMDAMNDARRRGMTDAVTGLAEAAINAQTIGSPDVAGNPIGMGFTDAMSAAQQLVSRTASDDTGTASPDTDTTSENTGTAGSPAVGHAGAAPPGPAADKPSSGSAIEAAPNEAFVAWYCKDFGYEPIRISTVEVLRANELAADYPGGGNDRSVPLVKVPLTGAFATEAEAADAVFRMMSNPRYLSGIYAGMPVAEIGGKVHNLESCGGLAWFEQNGKMP